MINPKFLRSFLFVADAGSVMKAADRMHRAQSAVTRAVKELEIVLGVPLFERHAAGMVLTEFGRALQHRGQRAMEEMSQARETLKALSPRGDCNENAPIFTLSFSAQRILMFIELAEQRHMGAVADNLGVSQPAVSQALREFEASLGVTLVTRTPTGIRPTALGTVLAAHLRRALAEIRSAETDIAALRGAVAGHVAVGTLSLGRNRLLPRAIVALLRSHPDLTVSTSEGSFEHLAAKLRDGDLDFILGGLRPSEHMVALSADPIVQDDIGVIVRRDHPLLRDAGPEFAALAAARWVLPPRGTSTRTLLEEALRRRGQGAPRVTVETTDLTIIRGILIESDLVTAASPHLFQPDIESGALAVLPIPLGASARGIGIIRRTGSELTIAARLLIDNIKAIGRL